MPWRTIWPASRAAGSPVFAASSFSRMASVSGNEHLTPHSLRRTFASLLFAIGETPPYVMAQMGHTTPNLTLTIYARQMDRRDGESERLKALVQGCTGH